MIHVLKNTHHIVCINKCRFWQLLWCKALAVILRVEVSNFWTKTAENTYQSCQKHLVSVTLHQLPFLRCSVHNKSIWIFMHSTNQTTQNKILSHIINLLSRGHTAKWNRPVTGHKYPTKQLPLQNHNKGQSYTQEYKL